MKSDVAVLVLGMFALATMIASPVAGRVIPTYIPCNCGTQNCTGRWPCYYCVGCAPTGDRDRDDLTNSQEASLGSLPWRKDLFVEMDYMVGHYPSAGARDYFVNYYGSLGVTVHIFVDDQLPVANLTVADVENYEVNHHDLKSTHVYVLYANYYQSDPLHILGLATSRAGAAVFDGLVDYGVNLHWLYIERQTLLHEIGHTIDTGRWDDTNGEVYCGTAACIMARATLANCNITSPQYCSNCWSTYDLIDKWSTEPGLSEVVFIDGI